MEEKKEALRRFLRNTADRGSLLVMLAIDLALLLTDIIALSTALNFLVFAIILAIFQVLAYIAYKDVIAVERKSLFKRSLQVGIALLFSHLTSAPFLALVRLLNRKGIVTLNAMTSVSVMMSVIGIALAIAFLVSEFGKKLIDHLDKDFTIFEVGETVEEEPGYVVLCKDMDAVRDLFKGKDEEVIDELVMDSTLVEQETIRQHAKVEEILPYEDRFLHMLVLGPTGCGKTSQILLPMCWQDMQNLDAGVSVIDPKGDFAQKAAMMAEKIGRQYIYFDPSLKGCPHFNPLSGKESEVVENMATTFRMLNPDSPTFFLDLDEQLVRNAVKVLKRLDKDCGVEGKYANLINMSRLLQNSGNAGRQLTQSLLKVNSPTPEEAKENADIVAWFQNDYFAERSKVYENTSEVRSQVAKITSNEYLREVLNPDPEKGERNDLDFDKHLEEGTVICISTAQGTLRALSKFLGYFIILQFQSAVFRRPGTENTRRPHYLYIDEFQTYSTPGFADMLTQGRSYRVASILATQARDQMAMGGGRDGRNFVNLVSTNARNVVLFPGCNNDDTEYYSKNFGEYEKVELQKSISEKKFDLLRGGFTMLGHPTESVKESKKSTAIFSASDLRFQRNSVITYCIVKHKTLQMAKRGIVSYIPQELNQDLNKMIDEYLAQHAWGDDLAVDGDRIPMPDFDGSNQEDDDILHFTDGLDDAGSEGGEDEDILGMPAGASMAEAANDLKDPFAEAVETEF